MIYMTMTSNNAVQIRLSINCLPFAKNKNMIGVNYYLALTTDMGFHELLQYMWSINRPNHNFFYVVTSGY
jgi:hypothetical protein